MRFCLRAVSYFRRDWPLIVLQLTLIGISTGLGLLSAWPMAILVDSVFGTPDKRDWIHRLFLGMLPSDRLGQIIGLAVAGLVLKFAGDSLSAAQTVVGNQINYNGLMRIRCELYRKLQALSLSYHHAQPQGDAIYRLSTDTYGCQTILTVLMSTIVACATLTVMAIILASRSVPLTCVAISVAPLLALANLIYGRKLTQRTLECKEQDSQFTSAVQRSMSSIGLIQAFGREADEYQQFQSTIRGNIRAWWRLNWQQLAYNMIVGTLFGISGAAVVGYGGYLVYRDQYLLHKVGGMTVGDLLVFTSYLGMLWGPLCSLTGFSVNIQGGVAGARRVFEVLDRDPIITDRAGALPLPRAPRTIGLENVAFEYLADQPVLRDVSLKIKPVEMVAFVGPSGAGKSTILNLLPRFYDPTGGAVLFDGLDSRQVKVHDLRQHIALVLQDSVILPTTIAENIAYGRPSATRPQIERAAEMAGCGQFIAALPGGYDTRLTEAGQNLSGGQRQRISIARALLTEAPIIMLDEPTSALDPHHERLICQSLRAIKGTRTIVLVTHRLNVALDCDQIFVLNNGRIVERGTHRQLMDMRGFYFEMARQQFNFQTSDRVADAQYALATI